MRKTPVAILPALIVAALVILFALLIAGAAHAEGLVSLHVGNFDPGSDYSKTLKEGPDYGIYYTYVAGTLGFEGGMHGYSVSDNSVDIGVVGLEMLITMQPETETIQPYLGLGFGTYNIVVEPATGSSSHGEGSGFIAQGGLRIYLEQSFVGVQVKTFTNKWEDPADPNRTVDYGGTSATIFIGTVF